MRSWKLSWLTFCQIISSLSTRELTSVPRCAWLSRLVWAWWHFALVYLSWFWPISLTQCHLQYMSVGIMCLVHRFNVSYIWAVHSSGHRYPVFIALSGLLRKFSFYEKKHKNKIKQNLTNKLINQPISPNPQRFRCLESNCRDPKASCLDSQGKCPLKSLPGCSHWSQLQLRVRKCGWASRLLHRCSAGLRASWPDYVSKCTELISEGCLSCSAKCWYLLWVQGFALLCLF